jgi:hypothetical protein
MTPIARIAIYLIAGLAAQFLWSYIALALPALMPEASSTLAWQVSLAFSGLFLALALVGPLVLIAPPGWPHCGAALVIGYLLGGVPRREPDGELVLLFQMPYIWGWVFLAVSLILIWLRSRGHTRPTVA